MSLLRLKENAAAMRFYDFVDSGFSYLGRQLALRHLPFSMTSLFAEPGGTARWRLLQGSRSGLEPLDSILQHADISRLRTLLAHREYFVQRLNDHRVREAVSQEIRRGSLGLFERIDARLAERAPAPLPAPGRGGASLPSSAATSSHGRKPEPVAPMQRVSHPTTAPIGPTRIEPAHDTPAALDERAQAATLRLAARDGIPFCEICDKTRKARSGLDSQPALAP